MFTTTQNVHPTVTDKVNIFTTLPTATESQPDPKLDALLADLSPDTPWSERKMAAQRLGHMRNPAATPGLLAALPNDPFWMVRCAIIQALEIIGDARAIPILRDVAKNDSFQVVRAYAAKAIVRLS